MYYKITKKLLDIAEGRVPGQSAKLARDVLFYLDLTVKLGKHFVFADSETFRRIFMINSNLDSLKSVFSSYSEFGAIASRISWHVEFVGTDEEARKDISLKTVYLRIDSIPYFELFSETRLLCENLKDIRFYDFVLKWYKLKNGLNIQCKYYPLLGGGGTTNTVYSNEIDRRTCFIVCVTDSDYKYKNTINPKSSLGDSALGETAKSVHAVEKEKGCYCSFFYFLSGVSELENLVPICVYERVAQKNSDLLPRYNALKTIYDHNSDYLSYIDMKNGISLQRISYIHPSDNIIEIVSTVRTINENIVKADTDIIVNELKQKGIDKDIELFERFKKEKMKKKKYVEGLGQNIMSMVLDELKDLDFDSASPAQNKEIQYIGELLFNWSCALPLTRS